MAEGQMERFGGSRSWGDVMGREGRCNVPSGERGEQSAARISSNRQTGRLELSPALVTSKDTARTAVGSTG